ncbi:type VI secretion system protein VasL [Paramixta manurensis]|uniref:Type VI secretion system protein VasL n=1 Tax=Paramixta manurensis TaxID=2740817 RepID=A0A6M8UA80_9GAMM|nr:type VI secretion system protein VasL [Erwiniaceae bacterium PD-1]
MMRSTGPRQIRTGGDPRSFPDFTALRDEMSKQTHPARPDIHWDRVEKLALSLFEKNGIELQTGAWYTLARSHLAQCVGMNEGLSILGAMLGHQWAQCWPQNPHARVEILAGLFQRLQKVFRTFSLGFADHLSLLNLETTLGALSDTLVRQELQPVSQITPLLQQVRSAITRLENTSSTELPLTGITLGGSATSEEEPLVGQPDHLPPQLVYVIRQEPAVQVDVAEGTPPPKRGRAFIGGMVTAFVVSAVAFAGWYSVTRQPSNRQVLNAVLQPLPRALTPVETAALKVDKKQDELAAQWISQASARLNTLAALPPDWNIRYGQGLVSQANALWPSRSDAKQLSIQWQQHLVLNGISADTLNGWHEGMSGLQALTRQLNALDGQKGKYLTVSELKSQIFSATQAFNRSVPVEEQLRRMSANPDPKTIPEAQRMQAEQQLKQLIVGYSILSQKP